MIRLLLGSKGERLAVKYLKRKGYVILKKNYRCPSGEIDIIARDGEVVVFVEVKTRTGEQFGHAIEAVDSRKQRKIHSVALHYLTNIKGPQPPARFDIISVLVGDKDEVDHLIDAFEI